MQTDDNIHGQCLCGSVKFCVTGRFPNLYKCFCTLCQKQGGTASNASSIVRFENFAWLDGKNNVEPWQKSTGFSSHFCKTCGSPVPNDFRQQYVWVPAGLLIQPVDARIVAYIHLSSKPAWEEPVPVKHQFEQGADSVETLVELLENPD